MPKEITLSELRELLAASPVQLIEVLPPNEYEEEHLAGSINIPLKSMDREAVGSLNPARPTVVYCWDDI